MEAVQSPAQPHCECSLKTKPGLMPMVNELLSHGVSAYKIERICKDKGRAIKSETVTRHLKNCLGGKRPSPNPIAVANVAASGPHAPGITREDRDLARLVQEKAVEGLLDGSLRVSVKDGLAATALIDKREARMEDQKFMLGLARLLSGAGERGPVDPHVIDVTPVNPLLAPASLRADE